MQNFYLQQLFPGNSIFLMVFQNFFNKAINTKLLFLSSRRRSIISADHGFIGQAFLLIPAGSSNTNYS
ncbi:MAG: hypothetical protein B6D37_15535 [Sphingobacteriales bacterium UTBCD1]|nr:MAG: hypothetical protein B6D37_15535 [Sphingobacteriales bacterium UTBCD1]